MKLDVADLKESLSFLNSLYDNVTSAIFLSDGDARIVSFNDSFNALFHKPEDAVIGELCGNALGCIYQVKEGVDCGLASNCGTCELRTNIVRSFTEKVPVYKESMVRDFVVCGEVLRKHFVFTTKYEMYQGVEYVLVIIDDVTALVVAQEELERRNADLSERNAALEVALRELARQLSESIGALDFARMDRNTLSRELRHRVGNNLQVISSLLRYERCEQPGMDTVLDRFNLRLSSIMHAYSHAQYEDGQASVSASQFIRALCDESSVFTKGALTVDIGEEFSIDIQKAVPAGIALVETLCMLMGLQGGSSSGPLRVRASWIGGQTTIAIVVPDAWQAPAGVAAPRAELAEIFVEQLRGSLVWCSDRELSLTFN